MLGSSPRCASQGSSIPKFQHPSHALLEENGFKQMKYAKYYKRALDDRASKGEAGMGGAAGKGQARPGCDGCHMGSRTVFTACCVRGGLQTARHL
jgi:hypothetical protein